MGKEISLNQTLTSKQSKEEKSLRKVYLLSRLDQLQNQNTFQQIQRLLIRVSITLKIMNVNYLRLSASVQDTHDLVA